VKRIPSRLSCSIHNFAVCNRGAQGLSGACLVQYMTVIQTPTFPLVIVLGLLAACSNMLGGLLAVYRPVFKEGRRMLALAFSGGFLLSVAVINLLPEVIAGHPYAPHLVLGGYFLVYLSEHLFAGHAHHAGHKHRGGHQLIGELPCEKDDAPIRQGAAFAATGGLLLHSFFDGAAITAALVAGTPLGWLTFFAVMLHKVPEGFSQASIYLASKSTRKAAAGSAGALGISSLIGSLVTLFFTREFGGLENIVLAVACGMFLHISATDLLPVTARVRGLKTMVTTAAGFITAIVASLLLHRLITH